MKLIASLRRYWCQAMHPSPMWPVNGQYRCPSCLRVYPVQWGEAPHQTSPATRVAAPVAYSAPRAGLKSSAPVPAVAD
jgi:hypothetical protein